MTQQYQDITKDNFIETLEYNEFLCIGDHHYENNKFRITYIELQYKLFSIKWEKDMQDALYVIKYEPLISTPYFNEFLSFVTRRTILKPLPVKEKFRPYWELFAIPIHDSKCITPDANFLRVIYVGKIYADELSYRGNGNLVPIDYPQSYYFSAKLKDFEIKIDDFELRPIQIFTKESNFSILLENGTMVKAIWHGKDKSNNDA